MCITVIITNFERKWNVMFPLLLKQLTLNIYNEITYFI